MLVEADLVRADGGRYVRVVAPRFPGTFDIRRSCRAGRTRASRDGVPFGRPYQAVEEPAGSFSGC